MEQSKKPQHLDQSNKVFWHRACNWTKDFSVSSKERWFLSVQTIHIKQSGTIFQMFEINFPSQKLQQYTKLSTEPSMTYRVPKSETYKPTKSEHPQRVSYRIVEEKMIHSFLIPITQHWFTKMHPLSIRLSNVRICPWTTVHTKKATLLVILAFQTPFHGKMDAAAPLMGL